MKTNHGRGFVDKPQRRKGGQSFHKTGVVSDVSVSAMAEFDPLNGHRGMAKSVRGAKKFVNSRFRHHENAATQRLAKDPDED
jgi:hypothetical protein